MATVIRRRTSTNAAPTAPTRKPRTQRAPTAPATTKDALIEAVLDDLLTLQDIEKRYGIKASNASIYHGRGGMPAPDLKVGRTPLWHYTTIDTWVANKKGRANS